MFIVLINGKAGWVKGRSLSRVVAACERVLAEDGRVFVTQQAADIERVLAGLAANQVTALAPVGGDGTLSAVLAAALACWGEGGLPPVLPLQGGTMNMVALSVSGRRESPLATLKRVVSIYRSGAPLAMTACSLLRDAAGHAGFVAGFGVPTRFLARYDGMGGGVLPALGTLMQYSGSVLVRGRLSRDLFETVETALSVDDVPVGSRPLSLLLAMTVERLPLRFRVGTAPAGEGMTLLYGNPAPVPLVASLPLLHRGHWPAFIGVERRVCRKVSLVFDRPQPWQLDGDIQPPVTRLELDAGLVVRLLV